MPFIFVPFPVLDWRLIIWSIYKRLDLWYDADTAQAEYIYGGHTDVSNKI